MFIRKRFLFLIVGLTFIIFNFFKTGCFFNPGIVYAAQEEIPWFLKMNMSLVIDRKAIEGFAAEKGWEKTSNLARGEALAYYVEEKDPWKHRVIGTLWSPTVLWIELRKNAELSLEDREKAEKEYRNHEWIFSLGVLHFTLELYGDTEEKISINNLNFILEDSEGNQWGTDAVAQVTPRGIEKKTGPDYNYYKNIFDIFFIPSNGNQNNWQGSEKLLLQIVYKHSMREVSLEWEPDYKFCIEEQFDYHFQKKLVDPNFEGVFLRALEVLDENTDISDSLEISSLKTERFNLKDNLFLVSSQGKNENFVDLFIKVLDFSPDETHFFIQIVKNFTTPWSTFAVWDEAQQKFRALNSDYHSAGILPYYLSFKAIDLEKNLKGVVLDTSFRHRMSYKVLIYDEREGYKKAWEFSGEGFLFIDPDQLGLLKHHEFSGWDPSFPITIRGYPTSFFPEVLRVMEHTYIWDKEKHSFNEVEQTEIFSRVSVINHFLKALKEKDFPRALEFIKDGFPLKDKIKGEKINLPQLLDIDNSDIYIYQIDELKLGAWDLPQVDLLEKIDFEPPDRPNLIMVMTKPKEQNEETTLSPDDIIRLAVWEFSHTHPWKITSFKIFDF